jgi:PTS system mannose-specific IIA component
MVGIVIVTHCKLADELVGAAELIVGKIPNCMAVSIDPNDGIDEIGKKVENAIESVDRGEGILILTDLFGGTPSNVSLSFLQDKKVEVLSGVNLPMLLKLSTSRGDLDLRDVARMAKQAGKKNISLASEIMNKKL